MASPASDAEGTLLAPWQLEVAASTASDSRDTKKRLTLSFCVGALATTVLVLVLLVTMTITLKTYITPTSPLIAWKTFALHPFLMTLAFGVISPLAAVTYKVLEHGCGVSHARAKMIHGLLMSSATVVGALGVLDMWLVHAHAAEAQRAKGWDVHFQSAHSWIGMLAFALFVANWCVGVGVFALPWANGKQRRVTLGPHAFVGAMAAIGTLMSVSTGCLSLGFRGDNAAPKDVLLKLCALVPYLLVISLALVYASAPRGRY